MSVYDFLKAQLSYEDKFDFIQGASTIDPHGWRHQPIGLTPSLARLLFSESWNTNDCLYELHDALSEQDDLFHQVGGVISQEGIEQTRFLLEGPRSDNGSKTILDENPTVVVPMGPRIVEFSKQEFLISEQDFSTWNLWSLLSWCRSFVESFTRGAQSSQQPPRQRKH